MELKGACKNKNQMEKMELEETCINKKQIEENEIRRNQQK